MTKLHFKSALLLVRLLLLISIPSFVFAKEKIIKQEPLSFEKCLEVIKTSESKLLITPEISDREKKRIAIFSLSDGTLSIICDKLEGQVTIQINMK